MKYLRKMLKGQGEREYREQHRAFIEAIPDHYVPGMSIEERAAVHPAYRSNTSDAMNYRRAHDMRGPQSKAEHAAFAKQQQEECDEQAAIDLQFSWWSQ